MELENSAVFFPLEEQLPIAKCDPDINNKTYFQSIAFNASLSAKLLQGGMRGNGYLGEWCDIQLVLALYPTIHNIERVVSMFDMGCRSVSGITGCRAKEPIGI